MGMAIAMKVFCRRDTGTNAAANAIVMAMAMAMAMKVGDDYGDVRFNDFIYCLSFLSFLLCGRSRVSMK